MEAELRRILDAVDPSRRKQAAAIRILEVGSVEAIRTALQQARYHVLYISCHARPGTLILEDKDGNADSVTADRFWSEALPANRGVPLIVLAGCSTGRDDADIAGTEALPDLARLWPRRACPLSWRCKVR